MTIPSPGNYSSGEVLNFSVTFDEAVSTTDATLPVEIGSNTRSATLTAPVTSGTTLTFEYTIQPADKDIDGITVDPANITGSVTDNAGNAADLSTATAPSTAGVLVNIDLNLGILKILLFLPTRSDQYSDGPFDVN